MGWKEAAGFASAGFLKIEDGQTVHVVPLTEPEIVTEEMVTGKGRSAKTEERTRAKVRVAVVDAKGNMANAEVVEHSMGPKWFAAYKACMLDKRGKGLERRVLLTIARRGDGIESTVYTYSAKPLSPAMCKIAATL